MPRKKYKPSIKIFNKEEILIYTLLSIILILGMYVRIYGLSIYYYNNDEVNNLAMASYDGLIAFLKNNLIRDTHPIFARLPAHIILRFTDSEFWLRTISMVPGILFIIISFLIGKRFVGNLAAILMAFIAAFGYEFIILSQIVRHYMLFIFCVSAALWFLLKYFENKVRHNIYYYFLFCFLACFTHYASAIFVTASGLTLAIYQIFNKEKFGKVFFWLYAHLILGLLVVIYSYGQKSYMVPVFTYAPNPIPRNPSIFIKTIQDFLELISFKEKQASYFLLVLLFAGIYNSIIKRKWFISLILFLMVTINIIFAFYKIFPFSAFRVCLYLAPVIMLLLGYGIQFIYEGFAKEMEDISGAYKKHKWFNKLTEFRFLLFAGAGIIFSVASIFYIHKNDYYRKNNLLYFPIHKQEYENTLIKLIENVGDNDVILTEGTTANYLLFKIRAKNVQYIGKGIARLIYKGRYIYFNYNKHWNSITSKGEFLRYIKELSLYEDMTKVEKLWIFRIGWPTTLSFVSSGRGVGSSTLVKPYIIEHHLEKSGEFFSGDFYAVDYQKFKEGYGI